MDDRQIIQLYHERSESAISATADKYGTFCHGIAYHILYNEQDSEECVNDTWLKAWQSMPPQFPELLSAFLGKITRNLALDKYRFYHRFKRGQGQTALALEELEECIPSRENVEQATEELVLVEILNRFLAGLPAQKRIIFLRRYWYLHSLKEIAGDLGISESKVKMVLLRLRESLKVVLEKEGIVL